MKVKELFEVWRAKTRSELDDFCRNKLRLTHWEIDDEGYINAPNGTITIRNDCLTEVNGQWMLAAKLGEVEWLIVDASKLSSTEGFPHSFIDKLTFLSCNITSLEGISLTTHCDLDLSGMPITSLKGLAKACDHAMMGDISLPATLAGGVLDVFDLEECGTIHISKSLQQNLPKARVNELMEVCRIIEQYIEDGASGKADCREALIDAGLKEYAE